MSVSNQKHFHTLLASLAFSFVLSVAHAAGGPTMRLLNTGWPKSLAELQYRLDSGKSYLIIASRNPEGNIDFRDADRFKGGLLATPINRLQDIGHNVFGWSCHENSSNDRIVGMTGQTGEENHQTQRMLLAGWGLTPLFSVFTDGFLMTPNEIDAHTLLPHKEDKKYRIAILIREVSDEDCRNVVDFMTKYSTPSPITGRSAAQNFGLSVDPAYFEGGGCGTTAVAALGTASFFGPIDKLFWRDVQFKWGDFGKPGTPPPAAVYLPSGLSHLRKGFNEIVPKGSLPFNYLEMSRNWSPNPESASPLESDGPVLHVVDPEMMFLFYRTLLKEELALDLNSGKIPTSEAQRWEQFTQRSIQSRYYYESNPKEATKGVNGLQTTVIDENFDSQSSELVHETRSWFQTLLHQGYQVERLPWGTQLALMISKDQ